MSERPDGRGGGRGGRNGRGGRGSGRSKQNKSKHKHIIGISENLHFTSATPSSVARATTLYAETYEAFVNYIRMKGVPLCHELADVLRDMVAPRIVVPTRPQENIPDPDPAAAAGAEIANPDFEADFIMWQGELKGIPKKPAALKTLAQTAYTELMELCDPVLKTKIK